MIVISGDTIVQWRRAHRLKGGIPETDITKNYAAAKAVGGMLSMKGKRRSILPLDETLGFRVDQERTGSSIGQDIISAIRMVLNKISTDNKNEMLQELMRLKPSTRSSLETLARIFLVKVIQDPVFWDNYIHLVNELPWHVEDRTFRDAFLIACQTSFESIDEMQGAKSDACTLMRLIARLHKEGWISTGVISQILGRLLLGNTSNLYVEYAVILLKACGTAFPAFESVRSAILSRPSLPTRLRMLLVCK